MSHDLRLRKLAELCDSIDYGLTASASKLPSGPKFLRITDIVPGYIDWNTVPYVGASLSQVAKFRLCDGDIVVARTGASTGASAYVDRPPSSVFASYLVRLRISESAAARYVAYALRSSYYWHFINGVLGEKSAQPNANARTLTQARIPVPPLPEQRAIAHILGTLDDKIELNRRMNATLDEIARTLFTSWFVTFDPVRARAEGRQPEGMDAATAALFPDRFVDSELGPIPEGWERSSIGDLVHMVRRTINPALFSDEVFDHFSLPAFDNDRTPVQQLGNEIKSNKSLVEADTVLISKLNPHIPRVWLPTLALNKRSICSTEFIVIRPNQADARLFVYALFTSPSFTDTMTSLVTGTTGSHQRVDPNSLLLAPLIVPSGEVISRYCNVVESMYKRIAANRCESLALAETRDTLLPELLSGRIQVPVAEPLVEAAVSRCGWPGDSHAF